MYINQQGGARSRGSSCSCSCSSWLYSACSRGLKVAALVCEMCESKATTMMQDANGVAECWSGGAGCNGTWTWTETWTAPRQRDRAPHRTPFHVSCVLQLNCNWLMGVATRCATVNHFGWGDSRQGDIILGEKALGGTGTEGAIRSPLLGVAHSKVCSKTNWLGSLWIQKLRGKELKSDERRALW